MKAVALTAPGEVRVEERPEPRLEHPDEAILHYNLACYECQMGNLDESKTRLKRAFELVKGRFQYLY